MTNAFPSRRSLLWVIACWSGLLLWSAVADGAPPPEPARRTVTAEAGDLLRAEVLQQGVDVVLRLWGPEGHVLQEVDRWTGDVGPELVLWPVQVPGTYGLEVQAPEVPGTWKWGALSVGPAANALERQVALAYVDFLAAASGGDEGELQDISRRLSALGADELALEADYEWVNRQGSVASWAEAADGFRRVAEAARQLKAPFWEVLARDAWVQALMDRNDAISALGPSDRVLELCEELQASGWPMRRWRAISHMRRQRAFSFLGRLEDAVEAGERAESLLRRPQESHWLYEVLHQRGVLQRRSLGDGRRAVADLRSALLHVPDGDDWDPARANTLDQLGAAHELLNDTGAARRAYQQSIDLDRDRRPCAEANHRARLALLEWKAGRALQESAWRESQLHGEPVDAERLRSAREMLDLASAQASKSQHLLAKEDAAGKDCGRDGQAVRLRLAEVARLSGQPLEAAGWHQQRLDVARQRKDPLAALESHLGLARAALDAGKLDAVEPLLGSSIEPLRRADALYQELRGQVDRETLRLGLDRAARQRVDLHLALLTRAEAYDGAWAGRSFEALGLAERETERVLRESLGAAMTTTAEIVSSTDWEAVRSRLQSSDGLLYLRLGDPHSHSWWLTSEGLGYRPLPSREVLEPWVQDLRRGLADPKSHLAPRLAWMSAQILGPWQGKLQRLMDQATSDGATGRLIVVADGVLSGLPWSALPLTPDDPEPLVEHLTVVHLPFAAGLLRPSSALPRGGWTVLADPHYDDLAPLPASASEADAVVRMARKHGRDVELWTGFEASKQRLLSREVAEASLLHVAAHATAPTSRQGDASLWLAQRSASGQPVDGRLQARDLEGLSLRADWVVLSACATGVDGWDAASIGGQGLAKGFLRAGARQVVSSLWPISDAVTAELMSRFYMELLAGEPHGSVPREGLSAAVALREAQRAVRLQEATAHPFYWAAFVVHGVAN